MSFVCKVIEKIADYRFEFFGAGYSGEPTEDDGVKMRWIENTMTETIAAEILSRLNYTLIDSDPGIYRCSIVIEKIENR